MTAQYGTDLSLSGLGGYGPDFSEYTVLGAFDCVEGASAEIVLQSASSILSLSDILVSDGSYSDVFLQSTSHLELILLDGTYSSSDLQTTAYFETDWSEGALLESVLTIELFTILGSSEFRDGSLPHQKISNQIFYYHPYPENNVVFEEYIGPIGQVDVIFDGLVPSILELFEYTDGTSSDFFFEIPEISLRNLASDGSYSVSDLQNTIILDLILLDGSYVSSDLQTTAYLETISSDGADSDVSLHTEISTNFLVLYAEPVPDCQIYLSEPYECSGAIGSELIDGSQINGVECETSTHLVLWAEPVPVANLVFESRLPKSSGGSENLEIRDVQQIITVSVSDSEKIWKTTKIFNKLDDFFRPNIRIDGSLNVRIVIPNIRVSYSTKIIPIQIEARRIL